MAKKVKSILDMDSNKIQNLGTPTSSTDAATKAYADKQLNKVSFSLENPTSSEDVPIFATQTAITITRVEFILRGSSTPSVTVNLKHGTNPTSGTTNLFSSNQAITATGSVDAKTSFNDATLAAGEVMSLISSAQSGTVNWLSVTIYFTYD